MSRPMTSCYERYMEEYGLTLEECPIYWHLFVDYGCLHDDCMEIIRKRRERNSDILEEGT